MRLTRLFFSPEEHCTTRTARVCTRPLNVRLCQDHRHSVTKGRIYLSRRLVARRRAVKIGYSELAGWLLSNDEYGTAECFSNCSKMHYVTTYGPRIVSFDDARIDEPRIVSLPVTEHFNCVIVLTCLGFLVCCLQHPVNERGPFFDEI